MRSLGRIVLFPLAVGAFAVAALAGGAALVACAFGDWYVERFV